MKDHTTSPSNLNATQIILTSLYQRLLKPNETDGKNKITTNQKQHTQHDVLKMSTDPANEEIFPLIDRQILLTEPKQIKSKGHHHNFSFQEQLKYQSNCDISSNQIAEKLKNAKKNEFLLQTYKEEVEYLKKLTFLQSQQIQKLRRMLRVQRQKEGIESVKNHNCANGDKKYKKQNTTNTNKNIFKMTTQQFKPKQVKKGSMSQIENSTKANKKKKNSEQKS